MFIVYTFHHFHFSSSSFHSFTFSIPFHYFPTFFPPLLHLLFLSFNHLFPSPSFPNINFFFSIIPPLHYSLPSLILIHSSSSSPLPSLIFIHSFYFLSSFFPPSNRHTYIYLHYSSSFLPPLSSLFILTKPLFIPSIPLVSSLTILIHSSSSSSSSSFICLCFFSIFLCFSLIF